MLKQFKTYQLSLQFYQECSKLKLPRQLKEQMLRAASSISLNLAEGSAKPTKRDQMKFFFISFGNLRECQAILSLSFQTSGVRALIWPTTLVRVYLSLHELSDQSPK